VSTAHCSLRSKNLNRMQPISNLYGPIYTDKLHFGDTLDTRPHHHTLTTLPQPHTRPHHHTLTTLPQPQLAFSSFSTPGKRTPQTQRKTRPARSRRRCPLRRRIPQGALGASPSAPVSTNPWFQSLINLQGQSRGSWCSTEYSAYLTRLLGSQRRKRSRRPIAQR